MTRPSSNAANPKAPAQGLGRKFGFGARRKSGGFTLIEVAAACFLLAASLAVLIGYLSMARNIRARADARRQAIIYADRRCQMFADGAAYPDVFAQSLGSPVDHSVSLADLPGGFPVRQLTETTVLVAPGNYAEVTVSIEVETLNAKTATVQVHGYRFH